MDRLAGSSPAARLSLRHRQTSESKEAIRKQELQEIDAMLSTE